MPISIGTSIINFFDRFLSLVIANLPVDPRAEIIVSVDGTDVLVVAVVVLLLVQVLVIRRYRHISRIVTTLHPVHAPYEHY